MNTNLSYFIKIILILFFRLRHLLSVINGREKEIRHLTQHSCVLRMVLETILQRLSQRWRYFLVQILQGFLRLLVDFLKCFANQLVLCLSVLLGGGLLVFFVQLDKAIAFVEFGLYGLEFGVEVGEEGVFGSDFSCHVADFGHDSVYGA